LRRLERDFPTIEADGCRVRIGVATGCDKVFIGPYQTLPVEASRKLKLVKAPDIRSGKIVWGNKGVVNPFEASGQLADLEQYPLFGDYIRSNEEALKGRHVARKAPKSWYRTIDRISPDLTTTEKLLIPDIKGDSTVVYDKGEFYPHHNLYVVTSDIWDLRVLQAVLRSSVSLMFVAAYCVRMGGGFLRFQAQYIRRIRLPSWSDIQKDFRKELIAAATSDDLDFLDDLVFSLYGLSLSERRAISRFAANNRAQGKK